MAKQMLCECGCGQVVRPGRRFVSGHNARVMSDETKEKMSVSRMGHSVSEETKQRISEAHRGKSFTDAHKQHLRDNHADFSGDKSGRWKIGTYITCEQCGKVKRVKRSWGNTTRFCSRACKYLWQSINLVGDKSAKWKGGLTTEQASLYNSALYKKWRYSVFVRDDFTCQECKAHGVKLNAHHILPYRDWKAPEYTLNVNNGITLCEDCHRLTVWHEYDFFSKYFDIANGVGKV